MSAISSKLKTATMVIETRLNQEDTIAVLKKSFETKYSLKLYNIDPIEGYFNNHYLIFVPNRKEGFEYYYLTTLPPGKWQDNKLQDYFQSYEDSNGLLMAQPTINVYSSRNYHKEDFRHTPYTLTSQLQPIQNNQPPIIEDINSLFRNTPLTFKEWFQRTNEGIQRVTNMLESTNKRLDEIQHNNKKFDENLTAKLRNINLEQNKLADLIKDTDFQISLLYNATTALNTRVIQLEDPKVKIEAEDVDPTEVQVDEVRTQRAERTKYNWLTELDANDIDIINVDWITYWFFMRRKQDKGLELGLDVVTLLKKLKRLKVNEVVYDAIRNVIWANISKHPSPFNPTREIPPQPKRKQ